MMFLFTRVQQSVGSGRVLKVSTAIMALKPWLILLLGSGASAGSAASALDMAVAVERGMGTSPSFLHCARSRETEKGSATEK